MTDNAEDMYATLNETSEGDVVELDFLNQHGEKDGAAVLRIDEKVQEFGDGGGKIICRNDVDERVHVILENVDYAADGPLFVEEKDARFWSRAEVDCIYD